MDAMRAALLLLAAAAATRLPRGASGSDLPSVYVIAPNDALSLAVGARRVRACGSGSSALIVVRNVLLDQRDARLCVALSDPDDNSRAAPLVAGHMVNYDVEVCLPPSFEVDVSQALPASTAIVVPFNVSATSVLEEDWAGTLQLRAVVRGPAGASLAADTVSFTVLVETHPAATGSPGCVGQQRFQDAAEIAGLYRLQTAAVRGGTDSIADAAASIADSVPHSSRIAMAAAYACLRAARPRFLVPQWCAMLRHPGCIESDFAPENLPPSPYTTTAELAQGWNLRVSRLTTAIGRARVALTHDGGLSGSTHTAEELEALELDLARANAALVDTELISSVLTHAALSIDAPPPPLLAIVFMTTRPGGYDVLLSSLAAQTDKRYELFCVDELASARRSTVYAQATALGVNLVGLEPGKARPRPPRPLGEKLSEVDANDGHWRFGYANAMNTGLIGIANRHAGKTAEHGAATDSIYCSVFSLVVVHSRASDWN